MSQTTLSESEILALERPEPSLLSYYGLSSLVLGPFFFIALIPLFFRFRSLRYRFDEEGVSMRWGILFHREINLTYTRIQDIHLVSNLVERWLGLARIKIQTASGSAKAEMTIEGIAEFEALRDYLYTKMRGSREAAADRQPESDETSLPPAAAAELTATLQAVAEELRSLRLTLEQRPPVTGESGDA